jgi:hypothetical protein
MIIPKNIPFGLLNMKISYETKGSQFNTSAIIPFSILKFAFY